MSGNIPRCDVNYSWLFGHHQHPLHLLMRKSANKHFMWTWYATFAFKCQSRMHLVHSKHYCLVTGLHGIFQTEPWYFRLCDTKQDISNLPFISKILEKVPITYTSNTKFPLWPFPVWFLSPPQHRNCPHKNHQWPPYCSWLRFSLHPHPPWP